MKMLIAIGSLLAVLPLAAFADASSIPEWIRAGDEYVYTYKAAEGEGIASSTIQYPDAETVSIDSDEIASDEDGVVSITIPAATTHEPGMAKLRLALKNGETIETELAVSHYQEIDITGPAAESLFTPLPTDDYLVDYIPCCNIYGGLLIAERIPVNPWGTNAGLPAALLTDFVKLEPDGLTASTMGLYFEFAYDSELSADRIGLYEFGQSEWREVFDYAVDAENKRLRFHCPDGGTFVVAEKP